MPYGWLGSFKADLRGMSFANDQRMRLSLLALLAGHEKSYATQSCFRYDLNDTIHVVVVL